MMTSIAIIIAIIIVVGPEQSEWHPPHTLRRPMSLDNIDASELPYNAHQFLLASL